MPSNSCYNNCNKAFDKSGYGRSAFDPSLGQCSYFELDRRCKMKCDNPNIEFGPCEQPFPERSPEHPSQASEISNKLTEIRDNFHDLNDDYFHTSYDTIFP